jgi:hypothetical protein
MRVSSQQRQQWGLRGRGLEPGATPQARRGSTWWMYLIDCGPQQGDGAIFFPGT